MPVGKSDHDAADDPIGQRRRPLVFARAAERGVVRRRIADRLVRLSDSADDLRSREITRLDVGDEVEILGQHGTLLWIRTPTGDVGWIPSTSIDDDGPAAR